MSITDHLSVRLRTCGSSIFRVRLTNQVRTRIFIAECVGLQPDDLSVRLRTCGSSIFRVRLKTSSYQNLHCEYVQLVRYEFQSCANSLQDQREAAELMYEICLRPNVWWNECTLALKVPTDECWKFAGAISPLEGRV